MSSLSDRLARLRSTGSAPRINNRKRDSRVDGTPPPEPGWKPVGEGLWERTIEHPAILPEVIGSCFVFPELLESENLFFYDLETTGLSGGAGNIAFLIGLGRQKAGKFLVTQLFLEDYPGETALLERYAEIISDNLPQVSYNGRSFDSQVLKTRFLLNRMPPTIPFQIDLLYPSRRLWKTVLPNVTLGTIEKEILGFHRLDDLPGKEAPDAWFEWLDGDSRRIGGVFRHNADDIVSLAKLMALIDSWGLTEPESTFGNARNNPGGIFPSSRGMARQWSFYKPGMERRWLEAGWKAGEDSCGRELAVRLRREAAYPEAIEIWEELSNRNGDFQSAVEIAKYREHRIKQPAAALAILSELENLPLNPRQRAELAHRLRRLNRKIYSV